MFWAYTGVAVGVGASVWANVLHSYVPPDDAPRDWAPSPGSVMFAAFWPIGLFIALEILARCELPAGNWWQAQRLAGSLAVAAVSAVVSYRHMSGLFTHWDEDWLTVLIGPLAIDGLMALGAGALFGSRYHRKAAPTATGSAPTVLPRVVLVPVVTEPQHKVGPAPRAQSKAAPAKPRTAPARGVRADGEALLAAGKSPAETALKLGVNKRTVERWQKAQRDTA